MSHALLAQPAKKLPAGIKRIVFDEELIRERVRRIAAQISEDFRGRELAVLGILKGAYIFSCDLSRNLALPAALDFISLSRYRRGAASDGVEIIQDVELDLSGRDLLLVEDVVDTGLTLHYLIHALRDRKPASVSICALLDRPTLRIAEIPLRYTGFSVSGEFLVGYGLDYQDRYRNLPYIASLDL